MASGEGKVLSWVMTSVSAIRLKKPVSRELAPDDAGDRLSYP
jgi:hypothetical protein